MDVQYPDKNLLNNGDLRYFPRWEVSDPVVYHYDGQTTSHEGLTKDLSCAGARILAKGSAIPGKKVDVTIEMDKGVKVHLQAHILWVKPNAQAVEMGVSFYNTPDQAQELILEHAFNVDRLKIVRQWFKGWSDS